MAKKKDYLDGDHSFKSWFKLMWGNLYIIIFLVGLIGFALELINFGWVIDTVSDAAATDGTFAGIYTAFGLSVPVWMLVIVISKGFIQYWNEIRGKK